MTRAAAHHHPPPPRPKAVRQGPFTGLHHDTAARLARIAEQADAEECDVRETWEERCAIRQYLAHELRDEAEANALDDTEAKFLRRVVP